MQALFLGLFLSVLCVLSGCGIDDPTIVHTRVSTWRGNSKGALSIVFDDGYQATLDSTLGPLVAAGFGATHAVPTRLAGKGLNEPVCQKAPNCFLPIASKTDWAYAVSMGMEVSSHGADHQDFSVLNRDETIEQLVESKQWIAEVEGREAGATIVYPFGRHNRVLLDHASPLGFLAGRSTDHGFNPASPSNMLQLLSWGTGWQSVKQINERADAASTFGAWLVERFHLVSDQNPTGYPLCNTRRDFVAHVDHLKARADARDLWVATLRDVAKYILQRERTLIVPSPSEPGETAFQLRHDLDVSIHSLPITLVTSIPSSWQGVSIVSAGVDVPFITVAKKDGYDVVYDARPNSVVVIREQVQ
jgi:peptidoglycan/xylan/chitin deacetylase (PgdA/CDA1 family)